jgi:Flp pilus assembly protein TadD
MSKNQSVFRLYCVVIPLAVALMGQDAAARSKAQTYAAFQQAFNTMYAHPGDVNATLDYVKLAVELEDYEAALSPLERLLMMNPDLPEVRLELGVMYFKLHSTLVAKEHLHMVAEDKTASEALKSRARNYLAKL